MMRGAGTRAVTSMKYIAVPATMIGPLAYSCAVRNHLAMLCPTIIVEMFTAMALIFGGALPVKLKGITAIIPDTAEQCSQLRASSP